MSENTQTPEQLAEQALGDKKAMAALADDLSGASRRSRQQAAAALSIAARQNAEAVVPCADQLVDALNRPEAQTRWESLDALTELIAVDSRGCDKALDGAEASLFDESNGTVRLSAMKFLCRLGSTTEKRSEKAWELIDEAIQCYHGDLEFQEMLVAVIGFSAGKLAPAVKTELADRMRFDATNGKGALQKRAQQIEDNLS